MKYSWKTLLSQGLRGHPSWTRAWDSQEPAKSYDVIIIGGGGHGLATAYYLATKHGINNIAVLEKGWIGSGNSGRNTTIIRSNYLLPGNSSFYELSMKLWETQEQDLNFNTMVSQRGILNLFHNDAQRDEAARRGNSMRLNGIDAELLDQSDVLDLVPNLEVKNLRFPIQGALLQARAGTARHDAVVWGYARAASKAGVDIIENCEVTGLDIQSGRICAVETKKGRIKANTVGVAVAGNTTLIANMAGIRLPIESHVLQAFVTEAVKPCLNCVVTFGAGHMYCSQSDKGSLVFGGNLDGYNSYAQRGNMPVMETVIEEIVAIFPCFSRLRLLRHWGGVMDMSMDGSPIMDHTSIKGLYLNAGWCYGGFKATPASGFCFAHLIATNKAHNDAKAFTLSRFFEGKVIDEKGMGAQPNLH